jgi:hypothetical protein
VNLSLIGVSGGNERGEEIVLETKPRKRKPYVRAAKLEAEAYCKGRQDEADSRSGDWLGMLFVGAISGAVSASVLLALWKVFH